MSSFASARVSAATVPEKSLHSPDGETLSKREVAAFATLNSGRATAPSDRKEAFEPSVLADFDTGYVLDALSFGIIVLDKQLCVIYANAMAQELIALGLPSIRGRPLAQFLLQPKSFTHAARLALGNGAAVDYSLQVGDESPENLRSTRVSITPVCNRMSGAYVLVELSAQTYGRSSKPRADPMGLALEMISHRV